MTRLEERATPDITGTSVEGQRHVGPFLSVGDAGARSAEQFVASMTESHGTMDFLPLSLGNAVWDDANNDGQMSVGEPGLTNVPVRLILDANGNGLADDAVLISTSTDEAGGYRFTNVNPGTYFVEIDAPAGYLSSTGTNGNDFLGPFEPSPDVTANGSRRDHGTAVGGIVIRSGPVTITAGGSPSDPNAPEITGVDFGLWRPLALGNLVFVDTNNNGVFDSATESGLANISVRLYDDAFNPIANTLTGPDGQYLFMNLAAGSYRVAITAPSGYVSSSGRDGRFAGPFEPGVNSDIDNVDIGTAATPGGKLVLTDAVHLAAGTEPTSEDGDPNSNLTVDFGLVRVMSLGNLVWNDANNNGLVDPGEPGIAGATVRLYVDADRDGVPEGDATAETSTDATGSYRFVGLMPGGYLVEVDNPVGYVPSSGKNGSLSGPYQPAPSPENDIDNDDNGSFATIGLDVIRSGTVVLATGTEPNETGLANLTVDFGFFRPMTIGNLVWNDRNNNGRVDAGEPGIAGASVRLYDDRNVLVGSTVTNASGNYIFELLVPGAYELEVDPPAGFTSGFDAGDLAPMPDNGTDDDNNGTSTDGPGSVVRTGVITLTAGGEPNGDGFANLTIDIGLYAMAKVSGYVYRDPDLSGTYVPEPGGDSPYRGVTITISGTGTGGIPFTPRTTTTDNEGYYQFTDLPAGSYSIVESQPNGIDYDGFDTPGTHGGISPSNDTLTVTLAPNDDGRDYNFGELPPANAFGYVYLDRNRNGRPDPGERPIPGVAVTVSGTAFAGTPLARPLRPSDLHGGSLTAMTNGAGRWEFPILPPGMYTFTETQPHQFLDAGEQNGDPRTNPAITDDRFADLVLMPFPFSGPYNFGEFDPNDTGSGSQSVTDYLGIVTTAQPNDVVVPDGDRPVIGLPFGPSFAVTSGTPLATSLLAVGAGPGYTPVIRVFDFATGGEKFRHFAYEPSFTGGVRVATGDVNGDGIEDIVTGTGDGGGPRVRAFSGADGSTLFDQFVFESTFRGGVFVAVGDVNGDGRADIIVGAERGGGPRVRAVDATTGEELLNCFAFDAEHRAGVRIAAADFDNDGRDDIVASTGVGVATRVRVINAMTLATLADFAPYETAYSGGVYVAAGDVTGDGVPDLVVGADAGGVPLVQIFTGTNYSRVSNFFAFENTFSGGVRVATADVNGDARADVILVPGAGGTARTRILRGADLVPLEDFYSFDVQYTGGAYVG